jgi:hypothetical protein
MRRPTRAAMRSNHPDDVVRVAETDVGPLHAAEALHVHLVGCVDQDVADRGIGEQRRQRTHADRFVGQFLGEPHALRLR